VSVTARADRPPRARVVIVEDGSLALIRRVRPDRTYYLFPGGGVEPGETPEQAAIREAHEELGVDVELAELMHTETFNGTRFHFFRARIVGGEFGTGAWPDHANLDDEDRRIGGTHEAVWFRLDELARAPTGLEVRPQRLVDRLVARHEDARAQ
jgi:8-oxo-dGTP pyrophosphatase MutT (NUDIX family)